ncbi:heavy-metal-associated domain-containing protein [Alkaliphilus transvaalensis]|uniref:heavy-metal-associated domain-containing protein n=1 Tax=Alkaliphilus transvaalensis TaxID=114628 RepID=UPI00047D4A15|nr:heavy metal-associated domain-containing protein [Alkaliphilus transvaalensis]
MTKKIVVEGMKCGNCVKHVKEALTGVDGVISADVNLVEKIVVVETNSDVSNEAIKAAINTEKYYVVGIETL